MTDGSGETATMATPVDDDANERRSLLDAAAVFAGISAVGIAQPLLDIYGRNPSTLSAAQLSRLEVALFVALTVAVPVTIASLTTFAASRVSESVGRRVRQAWTLCFLVLFTAVLARRIGLGNAGSLAFIALLSALAFIALERNHLARTFVRYLGWLLPASAALFVFTSPSGAVLTEGEAAIADVDVASDAPLLFVVFDEMMLAPLLRLDGSINEERFPGFARLADGSTWYRDTTTTHVRSELAVPSIFSGRSPQSGAQPFSWDHPETIFTLLGGQRPIDSFESFTSLCPSSVCDDEASAGDSAEPSPGFGSFWRDVSIVYGHLSLPPLGRDRLPAIDSSWAGFGVGTPTAEPAAADDRDPSAQFDQDEKIAELLETGGPLGQLAAFEAMIDRLIAREPGSAPVAVFHGLVPHRPYQATIDGRRYNWRGSDSDSMSDRRQRYQAMTMQMVALDRVLLRSIERLEEAGLWDDLVIVVMSDHGAVFEAGFGPRKQLRDTAGSDSDYLNVPLFIKFPGQDAGEISDCPAQSIDVLPTILAALGGDIPVGVDGVDLRDRCPENRDRWVGEVDGERVLAEGGFDAILDRVEFFDSWVAADGDARSISAIGQSADLVGSPAPVVESSTQVTGWTITELGALYGLEPDPAEGSIVPAQFVGSVTVAEALAPGTEGVIVINGIFAGVIVQLTDAAPGDIAYTAMVDVSLLRDGRPSLELLIRHPDGGLSSAGEPSLPTG